MKVALMQTNWENADWDVVEQACMALSEELYDRPEYRTMLSAIRAKGHRTDYRIIPGPVRDGMLLLTVQIRDGGPTVGE